MILWIFETFVLHCMEIHRSMMTNSSVGLQFRRWPRCKWLKFPLSSVAKSFIQKSISEGKLSIFYFRFLAQLIGQSLDMSQFVSVFLKEKEASVKAPYISGLFHQCVSFKTFQYNSKQFSPDPSEESCLLCWQICPRARDWEHCYLKKYTC